MPQSDCQCKICEFLLYFGGISRSCLHRFADCHIYISEVTDTE